uniref:L-lactate permease n=1 Tax=Cafeteria roenbergensis TaxID=33653 RepID=A0A7S0P860_CAFRO
MVDFVHNAAPVDSLGVSFVLAVLPLAVLFVAVIKLKVIVAAILALATALLVATLAYRMPVDMAFLAAAEGAIVGFFPIGYIVLTALFIYDLAVATSAIARQRDFLKTLTSDKRLLALLIALFFGGFIEGAAGFSTPVALATAVLAGVGFNAVEAGGLALLSNTMPVAFGAVGTPVTALAGVVGIPIAVLTRAVGRLQLLPSLLLPFWIACAAAGSLRRGLEVWPACLLTALVYTGSRTILTEFVGPQPVAVVASLASMGALIGLLYSGWRPKYPMAPSDSERLAEARGPDAARAAPAKGESSAATASPAEHDRRAESKGAVAVELSSAGARTSESRGAARNEGTPAGTDASRANGEPVADDTTDDAPSSPSFVAKVQRSLRRGSGLDVSSITAVIFPDATEPAADGEPWSGSADAIARATTLQRNLAIAKSNGSGSTQSSAHASDVGLDDAEAGGAKPEAVLANECDAGSSAGAVAAARRVESAAAKRCHTSSSAMDQVRAWSVWLVVAVLVIVWALAPVQQGLSFATVVTPLAGLDRRIGRVAPDGTVLPQRAIVTLPFLGATGTCLLLSALISAPILGASVPLLGRTLVGTVRRVALSLVTIATLLALAFVIRRSGADGTLGLAFAETGPAFPFVAPIVGWLGVALTGSATSSNVLFGTLQKVAAQALGLDPIVTIAASAAGGPLGGMVSLQSVVVAVVATQGLQGAGEGGVSTSQLLRFTAVHSIASVLVFGLWTLLLANVASAPVSACYTAEGTLDSRAPASGFFLGSC